MSLLYLTLSSGIFAPHVSQGGKLRTPRRCISCTLHTYLCSKQQCLNYWWIHTCAIFHIFCISPLASKLNIVYFQVQDLRFNSINKKNIIHTVTLHFRTPQVRQSPLEGFPSLHSRYDKLGHFGKRGSKTSTQTRNEQNRAPQPQCEKSMVLVHLQESADVDFSNFLEEGSFSLQITDEIIQQKEKYPLQFATSQSL